MTRGSRIGTIAGLMIVLAVLATARSLEPDEQGFGTHQQLGLPPCTSVMLWGTRCPSCGMTTSWSLGLRGQWRDALQANAGGTMLLIIALVYVPLFCYYLWRGYWTKHGWLSFSLAVSLSVALLVAVGQWLSRIG